MTTTVTVEDIDAAAAGPRGDNPRWGSQAAAMATEGDHRQEAMNGDGNEERDGNAEDFVIASKRRRRIEIPRMAVAKNTTKCEEQLKQNQDEIVGVASAENVGLIGSEKKQASQYANNFRSGGVEFIDNPESSGVEPAEASGGDSSKNNKSNAAGTEEKCAATTVKNGIKSEDEQEGETQERRAIKSIADLVGGKMKFLSEGRPAVSGVQTMAIQLEVSAREWWVIGS